MPISFSDISAVRDRLGDELAVSDWIDITQDRIDQFARATGDDQWIHTDPDRAARESPFRATVAHGFLTLSLISGLAHTALSIGGLRMAINYGLNRVRFITPVIAGSRIRARFRPIALDEAGGHAQVTWDVTVEGAEADKKHCVAQWIVRYYSTKISI
jgi:acyl dehydratase